MEKPHVVKHMFDFHEVFCKKEISISLIIYKFNQQKIESY